jgi:serine/threonine protein kinase
MTVENLMNEKNILLKVRNPFIVAFSSCFQDEKNLYYVMEYCKGGPITKYLSKQRNFSEPIVQFYAAEVVLALKALHVDYDVIYRDLKPDNILLAEDGHIKLTDFGLSVIGKKFSMTGCGTPEYIAPEILAQVPHTKMVDYWSLGCMLFLFLYGRFPFFDRNTNVQFAKIRKGHFTFPDHPKVSDDAQDFIRKLLQLSPQKRLGYNGIQELMNHPFFFGVDWADVAAKRLKPPLHPTEPKLKQETTDFSFPTNVKVQGFTHEELTLPANAVHPEIG